jgi:hypothetical protein
MDWQQVTALGIVGVTVLLLFGRKLRRRKFDFQRDTPCGCSGAGSSLRNQGTVTFRARKGQRPEIIVKTN